MPDANGKIEAPPYASYTSFRNFISSLQESTVPSQINRGVFGNQSGSYISSMLSTLKWLHLIDEQGHPQDSLLSLVSADETKYSAALREVLHEHYGCLSDGTINLERDTTQQLENKFREYGIKGSTLVKSITFFLTAAKDAGYAIGTHMKTPKAPRGITGTAKRSRKPTETPREPIDPGQHAPRHKTGMAKITIPLHGLEDGSIYLPEDMSENQWRNAIKMAHFLLDNYRPEFSEGGEEDA